MRKYAFLAVAVFLALAQPAHGQPVTGTTEGGLQDSLSLLGLFGEPADTVRELYSAAHTALASDPRATFAEMAEDGAVRRLCGENGILHFGGPMLGRVAADGASVWVRTAAPAAVEVRVAVNGGERAFGPVMTTAESDLSAVVPLTGLPPNTRCPYRVLVNGTPVAIPPHAAVVTAPEPSATGAVRIAFGSCFHRWGLGNPGLSGRIRGREPAALLLMGDIAVQDRNNHLGLHRADYLLRDFHPAWRDLVAAVPVYATWDDHDYFDNDKSGIPPGFTGEDRAGVRRVFQQAWNNPACGLPDGGGGVFFRTRIGPCDVIMTDNRYFRAGKAGSFLGEEQMKWLENALLDCRGPFIILSCGTMWSDYVSDGKDSWGRWDPEGRERLFRFIEKNRIGGVLLISGDRHGARGFRIPRPDGFSFYEFGAACLGGRTGPRVADPEWTTQLYGIEGKYAFGEFSMDATLADPAVTFRLIQEDGTELHTLTLTRSQLTPGTATP